jgi:hypothetical protein
MSFLVQNRDSLLLAVICTNVLTVAGLLYLLARMARMNRRYSSLMRSLAGGDVESALREYSATVDEFRERVDYLENGVRELEERQKRCIQRVGMIRFDAFDDVGGEQSFSLALLDAERNGLTISSLYGRSHARIYAKSIEAGKPSHTLTQEESKALGSANGKRDGN